VKKHVKKIIVFAIIVVLTLLSLLLFLACDDDNCGACIYEPIVCENYCICENGQHGQDGQDGATWHTGTTTPLATLGRNGDMFLNITTFDIYLRENDEWTKIGNIRGEDAKDGQCDCDKPLPMPIYQIPSERTAIFGQTLSQISLPLGWTWVDSSMTVGTTGNHIHNAMFTTIDIVNYALINVVRGISVRVNQATPTYTIPTGLTAIFGQELHQITLPSGWTWVYETQEVGNVGTKDFKAIYTPLDINFYQIKSYINLTINQATPIAPQLPIARIGFLGQQLSAIPLSDGWVWADPNTQLNTTGSHYFDVYYIPSSNNFYTIESKVVIRVYEELENPLSQNDNRFIFTPLLSSEQPLTVSVRSARNGGVEIYKIPSHVYIDGIMQTVTNVSINGFANITDIEQVILPSTIQIINNNAFMHMQELKTIYIPEGVRHIGSSAFAMNFNLTYIIIPKSIETMGVGILRHGGNTDFFTTIHSRALLPGLDWHDNWNFRASETNVVGSSRTYHPVIWGSNIEARRTPIIAPNNVRVISGALLWDSSNETVNYQVWVKQGGVWEKFANHNPSTLLELDSLPYGITAIGITALIEDGRQSVRTEIAISPQMICLGNASLFRAGTELHLNAAIYGATRIEVWYERGGEWELFRVIATTTISLHSIPLEATAIGVILEHSFLAISDGVVRRPQKSVLQMTNQIDATLNLSNFRVTGGRTLNWQSNTDYFWYRSKRGGQWNEGGSLLSSQATIGNLSIDTTKIQLTGISSKLENGIIYRSISGGFVFEIETEYDYSIEQPKNVRVVGAGLYWDGDADVYHVMVRREGLWSTFLTTSTGRRFDLRRAEPENIEAVAIKTGLSMFSLEGNILTQRIAPLAMLEIEGFYSTQGRPSNFRWVDDRLYFDIDSDRFWFHMHKYADDVLVSRTYFSGSLPGNSLRFFSWQFQEMLERGVTHIVFIERGLDWQLSSEGVLMRPVWERVEFELNWDDI